MLLTWTYFLYTSCFRPCIFIVCLYATEASSALDSYLIGVCIVIGKETSTLPFRLSQVFLDDLSTAIPSFLGLSMSERYRLGIGFSASQTASLMQLVLRRFCNNEPRLDLITTLRLDNPIPSSAGDHLR